MRDILLKFVLQIRIMWQADSSAWWLPMQPYVKKWCLLHLLMPCVIMQDKVHPTHRFVELLVPHVLDAVQALLQ